MSLLILGNRFSIVETGTTTIAGLTTITVATLTRAPGKTPFAQCFITNNIGGESSNDSTSATIRLTVQRTETANEYRVVAVNIAPGSRTIDWKVFEI
jgi:hypothetical protein